jgi:hypothetical protein
MFLDVSADGLASQSVESLDAALAIESYKYASKVENDILHTLHG